MKQLKSDFKETINWNEYYSKRRREAHVLFDPSFQGVNILFVLSFEGDDGRKSYKQYYLPTVEIKYYNVVIDGRNFFDQPIKNDLKTYHNIKKIATGQGDDNTTGCLLDYPYFRKYYKSIAIDLSKQQKLDADPKAIQQIDFAGNQTRRKGARIYFITEEPKETGLDFSKGTVKVLRFYFILIKY